ncbi:alpha/beta hydrolase [soil metagenome]
MIGKIAKGLTVLFLVFGLAIGTGLVWREAARREIAKRVAIGSTQGIDEASFVRINGVDQWITVRGQDRRKPVLLVLHGGPGAPLSYMVPRMAPLERDYVVVQWDQRGAGKTLARAGGSVDPGLDLATMVGDGIAVSEHLRHRLGRDRITLLGHSWGSFLGVQMARARPDLYSAYVGVGMVASSKLERQLWFYRQLLVQTAARGDAKGLAELGAAGAPPWNPEALKHFVHAAEPYRPPSLSYWDNARAVFVAPNWSLSDALALRRGGAAFQDTELRRQLSTFDAAAFDRPLAVPVIVIQGDLDDTTPLQQARSWLGRISAPAKAFATIPGAGHHVMLTHTAAFTETLNYELRRLPARPD